MDIPLEAGFLKVALYGDGPFYTHAARQLPTGQWTSKLGREVDIEHDSPEGIAGGGYGEVLQVMKRPTLSLHDEEKTQELPQTAPTASPANEPLHPTPL